MNESSFWEQIFSKKEWGKYPSESVIRFIARNFYNAKDRNKISILELGLGTGANLWFCAREGFKVSGIEWSKTGVERFKTRLKEEKLSTQIAQLEIGDYLEKLDNFKDESFDAVIDVASLCCNDREKTRAIFQKAFKKLKAGGKFFSITLAKGLLGYDESKGDFFEPKEGIYTHLGFLRFDDELSIKELYTHEGFKFLNLSTQILENKGKVLDKLLIFEGVKMPDFTHGGGGVASHHFKMRKTELWKMSRISLDAFLGDKSGNFGTDIYFHKDYARLYGEVFEFSFCQNGFIFKTLGIKNKIPNSPFFDLQSPYGYSGFYSNSSDEAFLKEALEKLKQKALAENIIAFFIRLHPFDTNLAFYERYFDFFKKERKIVLVNTNQDFTSLRKAYSPRILSYTKKARKELNISSCDISFSKPFCELYEKTMIRNKADDFYFFSQEYFDTLFSFKSHLCLRAEYEGRILAFADFFVEKDFAYYHLSANCNERNANAALLDYFFELCVERGVKFVLLGGGVEDDDALFYFKSRFSTLWTHFYIAGLVFDEENYKNLCAKQNNPFFLKYRYTGGGVSFL